MIGLHPGRLVGNQRISRSVGLVETVIGKFRHQIENFYRLRLGDAACGGAGGKNLALAVHLRADLLAHGAPQKIRTSQ